MIFRTSAAMVIALSISVAANAQEQKKEDTADVAGRVVSQPVRDVGIEKTKIPPILIAAGENPYATPKTCAQISTGIRNLSATLGPDLDSGEKAKRAGIAEVGGSAVVNSIIPFRGVVREVSGAASAERRLEAAISAGYARRGYLRGLQTARGCKR